MHPTHASEAVDSTARRPPLPYLQACTSTTLPLRSTIAQGMGRRTYPSTNLTWLPAPTPPQCCLAAMALLMVRVGCKGVVAGQGSSLRLRFLLAGASCTGAAVRRSPCLPCLI